ADLGAGWDFNGAVTVRRLSGQVLGIVGLGRIGTATALRARAMGMEVAFFDPYRPTGTELALGFRRVDTLNELLALADVVSLHTPLSDETRGMIDRATVARMKPGMLLINTSRGPVVDPDAVLAGLRSGRLAGAALDVLPVEPPKGDEPLLVAWRKGEPAIAPDAFQLVDRFAGGLLPGPVDQTLHQRRGRPRSFELRPGQLEQWPELPHEVGHAALPARQMKDQAGAEEGPAQARAEADR